VGIGRDHQSLWSLPTGGVAARGLSITVIFMLGDDEEGAWLAGRERVTCTPGWDREVARMARSWLDQLDLSENGKKKRACEMSPKKTPTQQKKKNHSSWPNHADNTGSRPGS